MRRKLECHFEMQCDENIGKNIALINAHTVIAIIKGFPVPFEFVNRYSKVKKDCNIFTLVEEHDTFNLDKRWVWELAGLIPSSIKDEDVEEFVFELLKKSDYAPLFEMCAYGKNLNINREDFKVTKFVITDTLSGDTIDFIKMFEEVE